MPSSLCSCNTRVRRPRLRPIDPHRWTILGSAAEVGDPRGSRRCHTRSRLGKLIGADDNTLLTMGGRMPENRRVSNGRDCNRTSASSLFRREASETPSDRLPSDTAPSGRSYRASLIPRYARGRLQTSIPSEIIAYIVFDAASPTVPMSS